MTSFKEKSSSVLSNLKFIFHYTYIWQKSIFFSIGLYSIFYSLSSFIWVYVPKFLIDELTGEQRIKRIILILALAFIVASVVEFMTAFLQGNFRMKMNGIRYRFIRMLSEKTMVMDYQYTEDPESLNDINIALKTVQGPRSGIGFIITKMFSIPGNIIGFVAFLVIILRLNWIILIFLILTAGLSYFLMLRSNYYERSRKDDLSSAERKSYYSTRILSDFQYGKDIRAYCLDKLLLTKQQVYNEQQIEITADIQNSKLKYSILDSLLMLLRELSIYGYLIYQMLYAGMSLGEFVMYLSAMKSFVTWMETTMNDIAVVYIQSLYVNDFRNFLNKKDAYNISQPVPLPEGEAYEIEFRNVSFKYPGSGVFIFKNFSLTLRAGEKLAIVGINGAGKTTLVKLLCRLYPPTEGSILINGIDINDLDRKEYTGLITTVFQDIKLFAFNIQENITFEENTGSVDKLLKMLELTGLTDKISSLEKGVLTNIFKIFDENGIEFSGGELQKLALARALYKGGKVIIMDEPTAALDALAEYNLYKSFDELIGSKTTIYISHRLSSTRFCDRIALIENGAGSFGASIMSFINTFIEVNQLCIYLELYIRFEKITSGSFKGNAKISQAADYTIEFKNVSFRYPGSSTYTLRNVSIIIPPAQKLSIVGLNGAGKTTFIKLLFKLYEPTEGQILLGGIDIKEYSAEEYRKIISVVFQDFKLLAYTIRENVSQDQSEGDNWIISCLEKAMFKGDLDKLDNGIDTIIYKGFDKDGIELSGGQAQKIAIARALCKDAPIVILDEPTAALDPISEYEVFNSFNQLIHGKTAIYISHRLSSTRLSDIIAVFHEGAITEYGTHNDLLLNNSLYAQMFQTQAKYYAY